MSLVCNLVDISGVIDNLWCPSLFQELRGTNCRRSIYDTLRNYWQDRCMVMKGPNEEIEVKISKGCPEGSTCGQVFCCYGYSTKTLEVKEVSTCVAYADDLALIIEGNSRRENGTRVNKRIEIVE